MISSDDAEILAFWNAAREAVEGLPETPPPAWCFGATAQHADELLALVVAGVKTGTSSSLWDYQAAGERLPEEGELSIILDGAGTPQAVIETTEVTIIPFFDVGDQHAYAEGEGDRTLGHWQDVHERFWRQHSKSEHGFAPEMPVVCERFRRLFPEADTATSALADGTG
ncbi:ASCH domain-containing protein [Nesterenkonia muleiensis]|uniref:ASCH domain-containing protein n=1 Tax=Nesterenkonia muleiensis TaxID=2282648 RepID=UPI000E71DCA5|nr:ASCH domain-containing protein [Nesterenkonia muleiensis]